MDSQDQLPPNRGPTEAAKEPENPESTIPRTGSWAPIAQAVSVELPKDRNGFAEVDELTRHMWLELEAAIKNNLTDRELGHTLRFIVCRQSDFLQERLQYQSFDLGPEATKYRISVLRFRHAREDDTSITGLNNRWTALPRRVKRELEDRRTSASSDKSDVQVAPGLNSGKDDMDNRVFQEKLLQVARELHRRVLAQVELDYREAKGKEEVWLTFETSGGVSVIRRDDDIRAVLAGPHMAVSSPDGDSYYSITKSADVCRHDEDLRSKVIPPGKARELAASNADIQRDGPASSRPAGDKEQAQGRFRLIRNISSAFKSAVKLRGSQKDSTPHKAT